MRILITGGAGFIGVNAARRFAARGDSVTILDNFSRKGTKENVEALLKEYPSIRVITADVRTDQDVLTKLAAENDAILHLAAQVAVTTSIADPRHDFEQNLLGTFNVLEAVRMSGNKPAVIYSSTNKVYGALEAYPVREGETRYEFLHEPYHVQGVPETHSLDFHSPYGASKGAADSYVIDYGRIYDIPTAVFRQSCIYGPHQFGVEDQGWVAWFAIAALLGRPLTLYGSGKQVRDLLYVDDLTDLYARAFDNMNAISGRVLNVGGGPGNTLSLVELLTILKERFGYAPTLSQSDIRAGDQPIFVADIRKAGKELGWIPQVSVSEGIDRMHAWLVEHKPVITRVLGS